MASQQVLEALDTLHKQLNKMQPAIKQVEIAGKLVEEARKVPELHLKLIDSLEGQETRFKQKLLSELSQYADQVRRDVNKVVTTAIVTASDLKSQEEQFKQKIVSNLNGYSEQVQKDVNSLVTVAKTTITELAEEEERFATMRKSLEPLVSQLTSLQLEPRLDKLQNTADNKFEQLVSSIDLLQTSVKGVQDRFNNTEVTIGNRLTEEGKTRRDQLESNANAIKLEVQQLSDKLKAFETVLGDQMRDLGKKQEDQFKTLHQNIVEHTEKVHSGIGAMTEQILGRISEVEKQQASLKTFTFITWGLIVAAIAVRFL